MDTTSEDVWGFTSGNSSGMIIGVDLGTSNSVAAIWHPGNNRAEVIFQTPSTVNFGSTWDDVQIGGKASDDDSRISVKMSTNGSSNHVCGAKMILGSTSEEVHSQHEVERNSPLSANLDLTNEYPCFRVCNTSGNTGRKTPEEICTEILRSVKAAAEQHIFVERPMFHAAAAATSASSPCYSREANISKEIRRVVIGVPASFTEKQRKAVRSSAAAAGFTEIHCMVESTAAAVAYGLCVAGSKTVMCVDIGGGTTDVTILRVDSGGDASRLQSQFQVVCQSGVPAGGLHIDAALLSEVCKTADAFQSPTVPAEEAVQRRQGSTPVESCVRLQGEASRRVTSGERQRAMEACRRAKEALTSAESVVLRLPKSFVRPAPGEPEDRVVTSSDLAAVAAPVVARFCDAVKLCLQKYRQHSANYTKKIDEVVLVGGTTRIPFVQESLRSTLMAQKAVDTTSPLSGVGGSFEFCCSINAEEAVAEGLCIRGAILMGVDIAKLRDLLMMDALPESIGVLIEACDDHSSTDGSNSSTLWNDQDVKLSQVYGGSFHEDVPLRFMEILPMGQKLPCEEVRPVAIAPFRDAAERGQITLCIVERIRAFQNLRQNGAAQAEDKYEIIGTYDFPVSSGDSMVLCFSVDEAGVLGFRTISGNHAAPSNDCTESANKIEKMSQKEKILIVYMVMLVIVYVAVKVQFSAGKLHVPGAESEAEL